MSALRLQCEPQSSFFEFACWLLPWKLGDYSEDQREIFNQDLLAMEIRYQGRSSIACISGKPEISVNESQKKIV